MNFYRIDGWPVAPAVARDYLRLKAAHDKNCPCGVPLRVNSGYRTRSEQHTTFVRWYRRSATSTTRPPDYRKYQGAWWGRVGGPGVVQSPDVVSNHTRGYALDLNVTSGGVCQRWMLANAPSFGFNWVEGKSAREPWHWCWRIGIRPTASSPDPWEGRGAPDPVRPTDRGMTLQQLLGPSTTGGNSRPAPVPVAPEEEDEDMLKPTVHVRTEKGIEYTLAHPEFGKGLAPYTGPGTGGKKTEGKVTTYRGFMVTTDPTIGIAWARMYADGSGNEKSRTDRAGYIAIQVEASRVATAIGG